MTNDPRLERYLVALERALRAFPVSDRAEIITEIRSHVLDALERQPNTSLDQVLAALGEPETVANRYLLERGMRPTKPPISPIVKWLVIGFLGTFAMLLIFTGFVLSRFTPLLHVDDHNDRVTLLGGLLEVDGDGGQVYVRGLGPGHRQVFAGNLPLDKESVNKIHINFGSGKVTVGTNTAPEMSWDCRGTGAEHPTGKIHGDGKEREATLDLSSVRNLSCEIKVPASANVLVEGDTGKLILDKPRFNTVAKISTGKIEIATEDKEKYRYDLKVLTGKIDEFTSSSEPQAYTITAQVDTGKIEHE